MDALHLAALKEHFHDARLLKAPPGMNNCDALAVAPLADGRLVSFWYPTPEEKAALASGQPVLLHIFGGGHPPVALTVNGVKYA